jgi:hypothetical protein
MDVRTKVGQRQNVIDHSHERSGCVFHPPFFLLPLGFSQQHNRHQVETLEHIPHLGSIFCSVEENKTPFSQMLDGLLQSQQPGAKSVCFALKYASVRSVEIILDKRTEAHFFFGGDFPLPEEVPSESEYDIVRLEEFGIERIIDAVFLPFTGKYFLPDQEATSES